MPEDSKIKVVWYAKFMRRACGALQSLLLPLMPGMCVIPVDFNFWLSYSYYIDLIINNRTASACMSCLMTCSITKILPLALAIRLQKTCEREKILPSVYIWFLYTQIESHAVQGSYCFCNGFSLPHARTRAHTHTHR